MDHKLKMVEIAWAEMSPDIYGGEECNEHIPCWDAYFDGDKDGECSPSRIELDPRNFPPGTRIVISVPVCPSCGNTQDMCDCGFDWKLWVEEVYS